MDKERAKFVLRSFRPDGADTESADFAEALRLATSDRELGQWFMRERAFDAEFAEALARVKLPEGLRETVLLSMVRSDGGGSKIDLKGDRNIIAAMSRIEVPVGLRERIIEAMEHTAKANQNSSLSSMAWWKIGVPLAAAAGIGFAFIFLKTEEPRSFASRDSSIPIEVVQAGFVETFESPRFSLEEKNERVGQLVSYLRERGLPCGDSFVPEGLKGVKGLGCRELKIDGKEGSLICFQEKEGLVHLIVFRREDVEGELPSLDNPLIEQSGEWAKASWQRGRFAFALMSKRESSALAALF